MIWKSVCLVVIFFSCGCDGSANETKSVIKCSEGRKRICDLWENFKITYGKTYATEKEEINRYQLFSFNQDFIDAHNEDNTSYSYKLGMNKFGDMTDDEFASQMYGFTSAATYDEKEPQQKFQCESNNRCYKECHYYCPHDRRNNCGHDCGKICGSGPSESFTCPVSHIRRRSSSLLLPHNFQIPAHIDYRGIGYVTGVKEQKSCNASWAFSAIGALEGQHFRKHKKLVNLSEQNLIDCVSGWGCKGGFPVGGYKHIWASEGLNDGNSYQYKGKSDSCLYKPESKATDVTGFVKLTPGSETELEQALATVGPISIAFDASSRNFRFYKSGDSVGIYSDQSCDKKKLNHAMLAVGYGAMPNGDKYYILKNSWSTDWGDKGYVYVKRDGNNTCGIASEASYPLV